MDIEEARELTRQFDRDVLSLVAELYRKTGLRVEQAKVGWRQYGHLSDTPGTWVIDLVKSDVRWR